MGITSDHCNVHIDSNNNLVRNLTHYMDKWSRNRLLSLVIHLAMKVLEKKIAGCVCFLQC